MSHSHLVANVDPPFTIDVTSREIVNTTNKLKLIQGDHNSERIGFKMPRYIDSHDMSTCTKVEVHFINIASDNLGRSADVYEVDDLRADPDSEENVVFSWLVSGSATMYNGTLSFLVSFKCLSGTKLVYAWHTGICSNAFTIGTGMDNGESLVYEHYDHLEEWKAEILSGITPDWNASEGEDGHILNRTHWKEVIPGGDEIYSGNSSEWIIPEDSEMFAIQNDALSTISEGKSYTVTWNGTSYKCVAFDAGENGVILGNLGVVDGMLAGEEPFVIARTPSEMAAEVGFNAAVVPLDGSTDITLTIEEGENVIYHKIPKEYIPDITEDIRQIAQEVAQEVAQEIVQEELRGIEDGSY